MLTLISCVLRFDQTESVWMPIYIERQTDRDRQTETDRHREFVFCFLGGGGGEVEGGG